MVFASKINRLFCQTSGQIKRSSQCCDRDGADLAYLKHIQELKIQAQLLLTTLLALSQANVLSEGRSIAAIGFGIIRAIDLTLVAAQFVFPLETATIAY